MTLLLSLDRLPVNVKEKKDAQKSVENPSHQTDNDNDQILCTTVWLYLHGPLNETPIEMRNVNKALQTIDKSSHVMHFKRRTNHSRIKSIRL